MANVETIVRSEMRAEKDPDIKTVEEFCFQRDIALPSMTDPNSSERFLYKVLAALIRER